MKDSISIQFCEHEGQFRDFFQCISCDRFGHLKDDFTEDANKEVCNECVCFLFIQSREEKK